MHAFAEQKLSGGPYTNNLIDSIVEGPKLDQPNVAIVNILV